MVLELDRTAALTIHIREGTCCNRCGCRDQRERHNLSDMKLMKDRLRYTDCSDRRRHMDAIACRVTSYRMHVP